ncbi:nucleolar protein 8 [Rhinatrema bivittatum]|uniref:nucleolar protein 8 n=1 Tax=Rhinatrema bivittatum TaxID=194408 RepID=UPI00112B864C|nr:nucleolar protein 8 [Rhinatrema bivittatum]XP_029455231.1 nucleolar protein 8 [Rhinatrema bivittatum]XP_029455232.1 nucleolar protein 8 [Rhinatrema bivittatum]XP_029455233.1 nucleolar protein 8 [Rhinatrema bivittatum]
MEKNKMKRLYVGGLGHTVSQTELKERFNKFGDVTDVEIISRKDEQGNQTKTFAYLNISISETELKKCMSILNKTKWKGGTLQIELAKESFLHRLAQERQEIKEKEKKPQTDKKSSLVQSLIKAGVVDFQLKAVPGTEVPDHKGWVVSKFGRVLPVLNLKGQHRRKFMKYDPSKYCHNIRKLECDSSDTIAISQLTWHLEEGNDDISKKRRGEFPTPKIQTKKPRIQDSEKNKYFLASLSSGNHLESKRQNELQGKMLQSPFSKLGYPKLRSSISDSDIDSEEEINAMVEKQKGILSTWDEDSNLEVVGDTFELQYKTHWALTEPATTKTVSQKSKASVEVIEKDNEYDSADTDEIIAMIKAPNPSSQKTESRQKPESVKLRIKDLQIEVSKSTANIDSVIIPLGTTPNEKKHINSTSLRTSNRDERKTCSLPDTATDEAGTSDFGSGTDSEDESSNSEVDADYKAMMQNCYHLELTFGDLEKLAAVSSSEESKESIASSESLCEANKEVDHKARSAWKASEKSAVNEKPTKPDEILSSILEEESTDDEDNPKESKPCIKFPAFKGIGSLLAEKSSEVSMNKAPMGSSSSGSLSREVISTELPSKVSNSFVGTMSHRLCFDEEKSLKNIQPGPTKALKISSAVNSRHEEIESDSSSSEDKDAVLGPAAVEEIKSLRYVTEDGESNITSSSEEESNDTSSSVSGTEDQINDTGSSKSSVEEKGSKTDNLVSVKSWQNTNHDTKGLQPPAVTPKKDPNTRESALMDSLVKKSESPISINSKQMLDNQKRLVALQERQRERDVQKQLIQGALSNLDSQLVSKSCHIVFESDSETEDKMETELNRGELGSRDTPGTKELASKRSGQLFENSEDEDGASNADDIERFKIKTQFEGKAGEKLLHLQSRFGTDDRFRMDSRFLESASEGEDTEERKDDITTEEQQLAAEKEKNLDILQSLIQVNIRNPKLSKQAAKAKKFRDINALHYDPTKEDHVTFETKVETTPKESKAKRKKMREKAEKLPEVSKETYHNIAIDFKEVFGSTKHKSEESEVVIPWDKADSEPGDTDMRLTAEHSLHFLSKPDKTEETSHFTFSFFGDGIGDPATEEEPYKIETIKPAKVAWQEDLYFKESSSEDEDEIEITENEEASTSSQPLPEKNSTRFFFFFGDDERLKVGPKLFYQASNLDDEREAWDERRELLLEECRKRHKDAKRKVKAKQ